MTLWTVTDPADPARIAELTDDYDVRALRFSPSGRLLATSSARSRYDSFGSGGIYINHHSVHLWDLADPARPVRAATLIDDNHSPTDVACAVEFSPDGSLLATASADTTVTLWDVTDPAHPAEMTTLTTRSHWLTGSLHTLAFHPTRPLLATAADHETITLWDVTDPIQPTRSTAFAARKGKTNAIGFSPDGRLLATANSDATVTLWTEDRPAPTEQPRAAEQPSAARSPGPVASQNPPGHAARRAPWRPGSARRVGGRWLLCVA